MRFKVTPTVSCWIMDGDKVLALHRSNTGYMDGYYGLPGGHVEDGENIEFAAARELLEETGLVVDPADLELFHVNQVAIDGETYVRFVFKTTKFSGTPSLTEPELFDAVGFFGPEQLARLTPADLIIWSHAKQAGVTTSSVIETKDTAGEYTVTDVSTR